MVSIAPYGLALDLTHMYDITDIPQSCSDTLVIEYPSCSLMSKIGVTPEFSKFKRIVLVAGMEEFLSNKLSDLTMFIPNDSSLSDVPDSAFMDMDRGTARHIIRNMTMKKRIPSELLTQSPTGLFSSLDSDNRLFVGTAHGVLMLNEQIEVVEVDIEAGNGLIHITNGILWPNLL
jgi:uncharacterized surface protein with fasciclin (FAS1) repeats